MKKRTAIILVVAALAVGAYGGFLVASRVWSRVVVEEQIVSSTLYHVTAAYAPLKLLRDGQTEKATHHLEVELHTALETVDLMAQTLHRGDMLTNSTVVRARALDLKPAAINPVEPTNALAGARGSP